MSVNLSILRRIAEFYDDQERALGLLRKHYRNGFIYLPEGRTSLEDFFRAQRKAWCGRKQSGISHSFVILEGAFKYDRTTGNSFSGTPNRPPNLDDIERRRDYDGQYEARYGKYDPE